MSFVYCEQESGKPGEMFNDTSARGKALSMAVAYCAGNFGLPDTRMTRHQGYVCAAMARECAADHPHKLRGAK